MQRRLLPRALTALDHWLFSNTIAGFERAWSHATRQRALCSSFLRVKGERFLQQLSQEQWIQCTRSQIPQGLSRGFVSFAELTAMPRVSTAHGTEGIESRVKSIVMSPPTALGVKPQLCQSMGVIHGDFTGQKLQ